MWHKTLFASMTVCGCLMAFSLLATEEDKAVLQPTDVHLGQPASEAPFESIQIRGIRGSLAKSLATKRHNQSVIDAITAEDIGQFPDKNVAESLQRITGVSLTRAFGEGERISVRGTAPNQNRTSLNGQSIASADWWISSQPNRSFNYALLPSEIVSSLEINKSPEADHDEGSLGGSVNIKTRQPLDTEDDKLVAIGLLQYSDNSGETDPQVSFLYNWKNQAKNLGILTTFTRHERNLRRDGLESWAWIERDYETTVEGHLILAEPTNHSAEYNDIWSPGGGGSALFLQESIRTSGTLAVQWQPEQDLNVNFDILYSVLSADNSNQNFLWLPNWVLNRGGAITDFDLQDNTLAYAQYSTVDANGSLPFSTGMESIWRESEIDTASYRLNVEYEFGYWYSQYQMGYTHGGGGTSKDNTAQWSANTAFSVDTREFQNIKTDYQVAPTEGALWQLSDIRADANDSNDSEFYLQADFEKSIEKNRIQSIKFGLKYRDHNRDFIRYRSRNGGYDGGLASQLDWTLADYEDRLPHDYLSGIGNQETLKDFAYADINTLSPAHHQLALIQTEEKESSFDITEKSYAAYGKVNLASGAFKGNLGLRIVHTNQESSAYQQMDTDEQGYALYQWQTNEQNYTDYLPSLNFSFDMTENLIIRTAASRVMSRPEYSHLMASTNYNVTQAQGNGGNPDLEPYRAFLFDIGVEWYFDEAALVSATAFLQEVDSFITFRRNIEVYEGIEMAIDRPINGHGGHVQGIEMSYQQELIYGLGIVTNYTYVDGSRDGDDTEYYNISNPDSAAIPGHSRHTVNLSTYYETSHFSGRLSYNYRTEFGTGIGEQITDDFGQLDASIRYNLNDSVSLILDGINLTDEQIYTYEGNQYAPIGIYKNGRRLFAGIRVDM